MRILPKLASIVSFFVVCFSGAALANEELIYGEGEFDVEIKQQGSWQGFPIPQSYWVWIAQREGVYKGVGLLNGMTSTCISKGRTTYGISKSEIHCENTDSDGDHIYEVSVEECACAPDGDGGGGRGKIIGGTGKYTGIRGEFEIQRSVGYRNQAEQTWTDYVRIVGSWTLP